ncbi:hypothetical protein [Cryptosporidium hominis TU502]|uniref:hypothetical protein n=1 Tax=Cryptosporidium hominis (strain TU502) TaxID=353151 RepID=UPI00004528EB|nr:hypothetical protein [Cryptosporidium hominis TU502]
MNNFGNNTQKFVKNPVNKSANPNKMSSYHSFFDNSYTIQTNENKTQALTKSLKGEQKFNVSNIPPNIHSGANIISKSKNNENNSSSFFLGEIPSKKNNLETDIKQNMENEIIDLEEKKLLENEKEDLEKIENDIKYWNALVDDEMADNLEIEPELPEEGVNLSKIGMRAKISNWKKPEKEKDRANKDSQKENIPEQESESKTTIKEGEKSKNNTQANPESQDIDEDEDIEPPPWRKLNRPLKYINDQILKWNWYYRMEQLYYDWQGYFFPNISYVNIYWIPYSFFYS